MAQELQIRICNAPCPPESLTKLKVIYKSVINSRRTFESIQNIGDLIRILERRDHLNVALNNIAQVLNVSISSNENQASVRIPSLATEPDVIPRISTNLKTRVYDCIAFEIGHKWQEFGRALDVKEGYIDELDKSKKLSDRVYIILRYHEENSDPRMWQTNLLNALSTARRNDLRKRVEHIFNTHVEKK